MLVIVFLLPFVSEILIHLSNNIESSTVSERLYDLGLAISKEGGNIESDSDLANRRDSYIKSLYAFLDHPLGVWNFRKATVGGHSCFLDHLVRYGVVTIIFIYMLITTIYRLYIKWASGHNSYGYMVVVLIMTCILFVFNPSILYVPLTFAMPLLMYMNSKAQHSPQCYQ